MNNSNSQKPNSVKAFRLTRWNFAVLLLSFSIFHSPFSLFSQGTAFTYNGRLNDGGSPANGTYDLTFALFANDTGLPQVGNTVTKLATGVTNGLFTVVLDFGANFPGAERFLEIAARTNGPDPFSTLSPRQKVLSAPYAITAGNLTGTVGASQLAANSVDSSKIADGAIVNADISSSAAIADTKLATISTVGKVANSATTATSANSANTIMARDGLGNVAATAYSGSGASLTALNGANLTAGTVGSAPLAANAVDSSKIADGTIVNADISLSATIADTKLAALTTSGKVANSATTAASANTPSAIVARDSSGNFSASAITANSFSGGGGGLTGLNASQVTTGTLPDGSLSLNVALLNAPQTFAADKIFGDGAQLLADPSAATAPGLAFNGDPNTGIFEPQLQNTLAFATGGAERMRIDSLGRLGIGTVSPTKEIELQSSGDVEFGIKSTDTDGHLWTIQSTGITGGSRDGSFQIIDRTGNASRMTVRTNGDMGIGTTSPEVRLHVAGGTDATTTAGGYIIAGATNGENLVIDENEIMARNNGTTSTLYLNKDGGDLRIGGNGGASHIFLNNPAVTMQGIYPEDDAVWDCGRSTHSWFSVYVRFGVIQTSDERLKKNVRSLNYGLQTLLSLRPVSFEWKDKADCGTQLGLIAQEVEPVVPEAVVKSKNPADPMAMNYSSFIPILIKAIQEQQSLIEAQRAQLAELKAVANTLTQQNGGGR